MIAFISTFSRTSRWTELWKMDSGPCQNLEYERTNKVHKPCQIKTSGVWLWLVLLNRQFLVNIWKGPILSSLRGAGVCLLFNSLCLCVFLLWGETQERLVLQSHATLAAPPISCSLPSHTVTHRHTVLTLASLEQRVIVCDSRGQMRPLTHTNTIFTGRSDVLEEVSSSHTHYTDSNRCSGPQPYKQYTEGERRMRKDGMRK